MVSTTDCSDLGCFFSIHCFNQTQPTVSKPITTTTTTTTRTSRSNFAKSITSSLFPNTQFTNHESLPSLSEAFFIFSEVYPHYKETREADFIRELQYSHLSDHVCLDYTGFSLFSQSQTPSSFFKISYKSVCLKSQVQYGNQETGLESAIKKRIMNFINISEEDYSMVCTVNRATSFKLLAETYPFRSTNQLLTVYDYESEAVRAMMDIGEKRGAKILSADFSWPSLRIQSRKLKEILGKRRGLFVFPLQSRMTGARYPYLWMKLAQENGWHVVLDTCGLGPKDLDTLGLSLIQPDFIICSFYKVIGENPSGFSSLFIKKSSSSVLESSAIARSIGVVTIVPVRTSADDFSGTFSDLETSRSFSGPLSGLICNDSDSNIINQPCCSKEVEEIKEANVEIECIGLDHADSLGLLLISRRLRYITNWLVIALMKLRHPNSANGHPFVRIYGPRVKFERGPSLAFNVFDWKGEKIEPEIVQKLADRSNIALSCGFLQNIRFSKEYEEEKSAVLERRVCEMSISRNKGKDGVNFGVAVVNASLGFLSNFEDAYKLWSFVAKFLDADFVEKERWRYMALNQTIIEV